MDCDTFIDLATSGKKPDAATQLAMNVHEAECKQCQADLAALDEDDGADPGVSDEVLKQEVRAIFAKAGITPTKATVKMPTAAWKQVLALAAVLVLGLGLGFMGGSAAHPGGGELPRPTLSRDTSRLWLARRALEMGEVADAHAIARWIVDDPNAAPAAKAEAEKILATK